MAAAIVGNRPTVSAMQAAIQAIRTTGITTGF
jgi:hypothetical protein